MMSRCEEAFPVRLMCRLLKVSPSGYYAWRDRPASRRDQDNARLLEQIRAIHAESDSVYGSPKVWDELVRRGEGCGENRVARLMQAANLQGIPAVRRWRGRKPGRRPDGLTNHLARDFATTEPNTRWVTDITYIRTGEGWLYLAVVLDLATRRVIGWSMRQSLDRELVLQAVLMALWQRPGDQPVILHSDRGTQYTSVEYQSFLKDHGIVSSMSGVGSCYDNAVAESFFGLLKRERVNRRQYVTRAQARADVFDYIERFYNRQRSHSYADGLSPTTYAESLSKSLH
jgi:putative transposase